MLDRQAATANDRFAAENPGIHGDPLEDFVFVHGGTQGDGEKSPLQRIGLGTLTSLRPRPTVMTGCRSRTIGGHAFVHSGTSRVRSTAIVADTLPGAVSAAYINEDYIWLKGVHPDYLARFPEFPRGERLRDRSNPDPAAAKAVTALALTRVSSARPARTGVGDQRRFVSFVRDDSAGVGMGRGMAPNENQEPGKTLTPLGVSPARRETVPGLVAELDGGKARISPRAGKAFRSWLCPPVLRTVSVTNFSRIRGVLRLPEAVRSVAQGATEC